MPPIYFNNLFYDYYLVNLVILILGVTSSIGFIFSYIDHMNSKTVENIICILIAIGLFGWCLIIARINTAIYNNFYISYITTFMISLTMLSIIQIFLLSTYIQFAYTSILYKILMASILFLSFITKWYQSDIGIRMINISSMLLITCCIFIIMSILSFRFRYYLYYKSNHIDNGSPIIR